MDELTKMEPQPESLPAAVRGHEPGNCNIVGGATIHKLLVKYLGGGKENITHDEIEILLFALYNESEARGGIAAAATGVMDARLRAQGGLVSTPPQAKE